MLGRRISNPKLRVLGHPPDNASATSSSTTTQQAPPKAPAGQCKFFISEKGCRRGKDCRYPHTWSAFDKAERARRCLVCGAVGHKSKECKAAGGGGAPRNRDTPKAPPPKETSASPSSAPSSTSSSPVRKVGFDGITDAAVKVMAVLREMKQSEGMNALVSTVDKWVKRWGETETSKPALMDSGATHPLRKPRSAEEWEEAIQVNVALAGDTRTTMKQNQAGTLLSGDDLTQVIVPLGRVISNLGYQLRWTATECCLERGVGDRIPLQVVRGCPEVDEQTAQRLIDELERCQITRLQEATLESVRILKNVEVSWWSCLIDYVVNGCVDSGKEALRRAMFFEEREREDLEALLLRHPNDGGWGYMKELGLNRRTRKRLMRASTWVVRWDPPGFTRKSDVLQSLGRLSEVAYVNVGSLLAHGGMASTWRMLLWAACQGRLGAVISKDVGATTTEFEAHGRHRARVHFLHALAAAGQNYKGSGMPRLLVERRRGACVESVDWMCDGRAQRYCDEMGLSDPMFQEEESI